MHGKTTIKIVRVVDSTVVVLVHKYLISSFILMVNAFCYVNLDAGEILGIFIVA
jgi:hypothetical protein